MLYNPNDPRDYFEMINFIDSSREQGKMVDIKNPSVQRTRNQNSYYHIILRYYASQIGLTETEAEKEFKFNCEANRDKFLVERKDPKGNTHYSLRSSADLSKEEMSSAIANFISYSEIYAGIRIPYENDHAFINECKREINKVSKYI